MKIIKFHEQNRKRIVERGFSVNKERLHDWRKQKQGLCKAKCSVRAFQDPKTGKFLQLEDQLFKYFEKTQNNNSYKHMREHNL